MSNSCVIDIGGTNFRCGLYKDRAVIDIKKNLTPNFLQHQKPGEIQDELIKRIIDAVAEKKKKYVDVTRLGIAFPGPVNNKGVVIGSSVIFGEVLEKPFPLKERLEQELKRFGIVTGAIVITNDVTASAWRYSDQGYDPFCLITVSSGIGNKIFNGGKILIDERGISGEIGHFSAELPGITIPCSCGWGINHIGMISSGRGIEYIAKLFGSDSGKYRSLFLTSALGADPRVNKNHSLIKNEWIAEYADKFDLFPRVIIDFCTQPLGNAICLLSLAMYLKKFIIVGGFALNCNYYIESLIKNVTAKGIYNFSAQAIEEMIILGEKDDNHALFGLGKMLENEEKTN